MSNAYLILKQKHQEEVSNFPMVFAFSNEQFEEGMTKLGLTAVDTDKVCSIGGGGFIRKEDSNSLSEMFSRHTMEKQEAISNDQTGDGFIYDMFNYELANHEYGYTQEIEPTLDTLGITADEINADTRLLHGLNKAKRKQRSQD
jgi:hypothetical protein